MTPADRAQLIEQVAKIIAPPFTFSDGTEDEDWREELDKAEQIDAVYAERIAEAERQAAEKAWSEGWLIHGRWRHAAVFPRPTNPYRAEQIVDLLRPEAEG